MSELGNYFRTILNEKEETDYPVVDKQYQGIHVQIENPKGSIRSGKNENGTSWSTEMKYDYGRVKGTTGRDEDMLDVFVNFSNKDAYKVYGIYQMNPYKACFDEMKYMLGFNSPEDAKEAYLMHYDRPDYYGDMVVMQIEDFKKLCLQSIEDKMFNDVNYSC